ncbi:hypothetical protein GW17_00012981, partial [Ensete ventricosum]
PHSSCRGAHPAPVRPRKRRRRRHHEANPHGARGRPQLLRPRSEPRRERPPLFIIRRPNPLLSLPPSRVPTPGQASEEMNLENFGGGRVADREAPPLLARQGSIYALTFDELQTTLGGLGKEFGSMNMDELLKNVWTAEETYAVTAAFGEGRCGAAAGPGLLQQGSLTLPRTLSQKTVDEVWRDLAGGCTASYVQGIAGGGSDVPQQTSLGEMTLEEFLVKAGVVREDSTPSLALPRPAGNRSSSTNVLFDDMPTINNSTGLALGFEHRSNTNTINASIGRSSAADLGMMVTVARPYAAPIPVRSRGLVSFDDAEVTDGLMTGIIGPDRAGAVAVNGSPGNHLSPDMLEKANRDLPSVPKAPYMFSGGMRGRKRSGSVEKVIERRQRRMIKNRESAARSRARKQAYTMELEAEVAKLKEQNQELQEKQVFLIFTCRDDGDAEESGLNLVLTGPTDDQSSAWNNETSLEEDTNRSMVNQRSRR